MKTNSITISQEEKRNPNSCMHTAKEWLEQPCLGSYMQQTRSLDANPQSTLQILLFITSAKDVMFLSAWLYFWLLAK